MTLEDAKRQIDYIKETISLFKHHAQFHIPGYHKIDPKIIETLQDLEKYVKDNTSETSKS
jgi:hypothetical protein